jgi:hypothetical protein
MGPGVYSVSNRNECQKQEEDSSEVERGRHVRLTTSSPSLSSLSRRFEILDMSKPYRTPRPVTGIRLFQVYNPDLGGEE